MVANESYHMISPLNPYESLNMGDREIIMGAISSVGDEDFMKLIRKYRETWGLDFSTRTNSRMLRVEDGSDKKEGLPNKIG